MSNNTQIIIMFNNFVYILTQPYYGIFKSLIIVTITVRLDVIYAKRTISIKTFRLPTVRDCNEQCSFCSFIKFAYRIKFQLRFRRTNGGGNVINFTRFYTLCNLFVVKLHSVFFPFTPVFREFLVRGGFDDEHGI